MMLPCDMIEDLLPLYADDCCSAASRRAVEEHLADCPKCREGLKAMQTQLPVVEAGEKKPTRVRQWKASLLQSALLFAAFGVITVGVAWEAATPSGLVNGFWAFVLVVPATGFLLSLANWFFLRLYPTRRAFVLGSVLAAVVATLLCAAWTLNHYEVPLELQLLWLYSHSPGLLFAAVLWGLSAPLAGRYARWLGKE